MSAYDLLGSLVLDDGRRWGEAALDFQRADARAVLDREGPRRHLWTRPRGASKTTDLAGVGTAALLDQLPANARSYAYAAGRDQAGLLLDSIAGFVERTPELGTALTVGANTVTARNGASLTVESSDDATAWGRRPHLSIAEEFSVWKTTRGPTRLWSAIVSAVPKVPGSRLVVLAMAGDPAHPAHKLLVRARASDSWRVSEVPGPCPWWSAEDVEEARADLTDSDFRRLVMGEWAEPEDRLTTVDDVRACVAEGRGVLGFEQGNRYVMGLDIGLKNDRTVLTVAHAEPVALTEDEDGREASMVVVDRQETWQGTKARPVDLQAVEAVILEAWLGYGRPTLVADPYQAAQLTQRLRRRGVRVVEYAFSQQSIGRLTLTLYRLLRDHLLDLPDDPDLIDELATVRLEERSPGSYRIDHDGNRHDDRVISLALAAHHLISGPVRRRMHFSGVA